jgi:hypothetical protein
LNDTDITDLILSSTPSQAPFGLKIRQLPSKISSWLICLLQNLPEKEQWSKVPMQSSLWLGRDAKATLPQSGLIKTSSWTDIQETTKLKSLAPSAMQSEKADYILKESGLINQNQLKPPWIMYHRPLSWLEGLTQDLTGMENLPSFYNANSEVTNPPTPPRNAK